MFDSHRSRLTSLFVSRVASLTLAGVTPLALTGLALVGLAGLGLPGCHGSSQTDPHAQSMIDDAVGMQRFQTLVTQLSAPEMDGRGPGHPGHDKARDLIVKQLQAIPGLEPAFVINGKPSHLQPFEVDLGVTPTGVHLATTDVSGESQAWTIGTEHDAVPTGFSAAKEVNAPLAFVGFGIQNEDKQYNSYANFDAKGKAVVMYRFEPMNDEGQSQWARGRRFTQSANLANKVQWAQEQGAAAVIFVSPPTYPTGQSLRKPRSTQDVPQAKIPCFEIRDTVLAKWLEQAGFDTSKDQSDAQLLAGANSGKLKAFDLKGMHLEAGITKMNRRKVTVENIGFVLPGQGALAEQAMVMGAHYDHVGHGEIGSRTGENKIHPGADDNASGTTGVILAAQHLQQAAQSTEGDRRSVVFLLFTAEERGLIGSNFMVNHPDQTAWVLADTTGMVNLDMIGRLRNQTLTVLGVESHPAWQTPLREALALQDIRLELDESQNHRSDHRGFLQNGIPAVHLFTNLHEDYHTPRDTADKINTEGGWAITKSAAILVQSLWQKEDPLPLDAFKPL